MSWLWKGDVNSPASFEKALAKLSTQITTANLALDTSRSRARRAKALWTLYTTLTYLLYTLIITLVLGPQNWALPHYGGLVGAPILIYGVRKLLTLFFDWNIDRQQAYLEGLQKQREAKITDLKKATKYDSTQELLQKYGGGPPKQTPSKQPQNTKRKITPSNQAPPQRTGLPPPPTANIPGRNITPQSTPHRPNVSLSSTTGGEQSPMSPPMAHSLTAVSDDEPGFAPNAFGGVPPTARPLYDITPRWYDRILDVLLGEDETAAKNRLALICAQCRLVNGQAPPGIRTLEQLGKWKCSSCGAWNGEESESAKVVKEMTEKSKVEHTEDWEQVRRADELDEGSGTNGGSAVDNLLSGKDVASGRDSEDDSGISKRVTRSANKQGPMESLD